MEEKVEVLDRFENIIAVFTKDDTNDKDKMINPIVDLTQNGENTFSFQISPDSDKWKEIQSVENFYKVNGRVFSPKFDGSYIENLTEDNQNLITVNCYERQMLLQRQYVKAWNSVTGFGTDDQEEQDRIDDFMVVILSGGNLSLKNGSGIEVKPTYTIGSAGYILEGLLYNTDWSVGIVDVEGIYDFETDQVDIYNNILKVQEMYGGILEFDSLNKIVNLRDELKYRNYNGYEVRWQKNMISQQKKYNNKIITRVIPLGEAGLNIKSINNGLTYLENFDYSPIISYEIINNDDIYDQYQLKKWGERKLKDMSKPSKEMTVSLADLRKINGHELEEFDLNYIVDVIDYNGIKGTEQLRVIAWQYNVFAIYQSTIELGDTTLNTNDIFRKISNATNDIINGTINASKVVNIKTGTTMEENINRIDETITLTKAELVKSDETILGVVSETKTSLEDRITGEVEILNQNISIIRQLANSISASVSQLGGMNKVINSVGLYGDDMYSISGGTIANAYFGEYADLKSFTISGAKVQPSFNQSITHQKIELNKGIYTLTMKVSNGAGNRLKFTMTGTYPLYEKGSDDEYKQNDYVSYDKNTHVVTIVDTSEEVSLLELVYKFKIDPEITTDNVTYTIQNTSSNENVIVGFYTDLIIKDGDVRSNWESGKNEIIGTALSIYYNGVEITSTEENSEFKTVINNTGFSVVDLSEDSHNILKLNTSSVYLGVDTKVDGRFSIQNFNFQEYIIDSDNILILL